MMSCGDVNFWVALWDRLFPTLAVKLLDIFRFNKDTSSTFMLKQAKGKKGQKTITFELDFKGLSNRRVDRRVAASNSSTSTSTYNKGNVEDGRCTDSFIVLEAVDKEERDDIYIKIT